MNKKIGRLAVIACACAMCGCASFSTKQVDASYKDGKINRVQETKAGGFTFFASKSSLAKWKATQSDKTQGASVAGLEQESDATAAAGELAKAIAEGIVKGMAKP